MILQWHGPLTMQSIYLSYSSVIERNCLVCLKGMSSSALSLLSWICKLPKIIARQVMHRLANPYHIYQSFFFNPWRAILVKALCGLFIRSYSILIWAHVAHTAETNRQGMLTWRLQSKPPTASGPLPYLYSSVSSIIRSISGVGTVAGALAILSRRGSNQPEVQKCPMRNTAYNKERCILNWRLQGRYRSRLQYKDSVKYSR